VSVRVKICGITSIADAELAVQCGADLIGLNFYSPSPRFVSHALAREICAVLPPHVLRVGVFVNARRNEIVSLVEQLKLHLVQFHGDEEPADLLGWSCQTIKAVRVTSNTPVPDLTQIPTNYILLDTHRAGRYGGTGETFAWEQVVSCLPQREERLLLAGGLTPENVMLAVRTVRPWAVDVASGVELAPGRKDLEKLRAFIANAKTA
jgi:phosphoribosylanthranilate isomerase